MKLYPFLHRTQHYFIKILAIFDTIIINIQNIIRFIYNI